MRSCHLLLIGSRAPIPRLGVCGSFFLACVVPGIMAKTEFCCYRVGFTYKLGLVLT